MRTSSNAPLTISTDQKPPSDADRELARLVARAPDESPTPRTVVTQSTLVRQLELGLRSRIPEHQQPVYVMGDSCRLADALCCSQQNSYRLLDIVNWTLLNARRLYSDDWDAPVDLVDLVDHVRHLSWILEEGGSAWTVGLRPDGRFELQRRVSPEGAVAMADAAKASHDSDAHLANAWSAAFGYTPNARDAYREAVNAVEHVACRLVLPNDAEATLGKAIPALRDAPQKWAVRFRANPNRAPSLLPVEVVAANCELLWNSDPRHGNDPRGVVDFNEARAAVHLAILLVTWFTDGTITRVAPANC